MVYCGTRRSTPLASGYAKTDAGGNGTANHTSTRNGLNGRSTVLQLGHATPKANSVSKLTNLRHSSNSLCQHTADIHHLSKLHACLNTTDRCGRSAEFRQSKQANSHDSQTGKTNFSSLQ